MDKQLNVIKTVAFLLFIGGFFWWFWSFKKPTKVYNNNMLIVGTNAEYPPYSFIENDIIVGFDIDIIKEVAKRLDKKVDLQDMPFDALLPAAQVGSIEVIAAGISPTPERAEKLLFTKPYLKGDPLLIISKKANPLKTVDELSGKNVVVNEGFKADHYMSSLQGPQVTRLATVTEALLALESDRADAFVTAKSPIQSYFKIHGKGNLHVVELPDTTDAYALVVSPKYQQLLPQIQKVLNQMKNDGTLKRFKEKWGLQ